VLLGVERPGVVPDPAPVVLEEDGLVAQQLADLASGEVILDHLTGLLLASKMVAMSKHMSLQVLEKSARRHRNRPSRLNPRIAAGWSLGGA